MPSLFPEDVGLGFARIAVERGVDRYPDGLTYRIPREIEGLAVGERVIVPLGRGDTRTAGYVIEIDTEAELDPEKIKPIAARDRSGLSLPAQLLDLARWISAYYCCPIGVTLAAMMPAAVKRGIGTVARTLIDLGPPPAEDVRLSPKQRAVLDHLHSLADTERPVEIRALAERAELRTTGPIKRLLEAGYVQAVRRTTIEADWAARAVDAAVPDALTDEQQQVIGAIEPALGAGFSAHLIHGVTGCGKTEIYVRLLERVIASGRTALVLVPEISLTPQTGGRLIGRFPNQRVAVLHSGLTAAQRHQQWALAAAGEASIVLGARSAVFAPIPDDRLGLIIIDEEHDTSYKQDQAPRYHGRDVAVRRAQLAGCPIILGSATPSLESWFNATERGTYALHQLRRRVPGMRLPQVDVVDFAEERRQRNDRRVHLIGPRLEHELARVLDGDGQALLLLNRRGYANYIACPDQGCGWVMQCDDCDSTMVYHLHRKLPTGGFVRCHHCLAEQRLPKSCPECGNKVVTFGLGTQRVEEELQRKFPSLIDGETMVRVDSDTMRRATDFHAVLGRFGAGELRVLIGTQMIAKGLDFPKVQLVGVINADTAIHLPDFRAAERTFQLVNQVAGRCGRGTVPGRVIVQTFNPEAPSIRLAAAHDYESFARAELEDRRASRLPPITRMVRLVVRDEDYAKCVAQAEQLAAALAAEAEASVLMRGPAPCPIARVAGRHRQQIELMADGPMPLQRLITTLRSRGVLRPGMSLAVDVDPTALL